MPTYEYCCDECGYCEDFIHPSGKRLRPSCPVCGDMLKWQFPMPALFTDTTFLANRPDDGKGAGFYSAQLGRRVTSRDDVKRFCQENGHGCEGCVEVKRREPESDPLDKPRYVNDTVAKRHADMIVDNEHGGQVTPKKYKDIVDRVKHEAVGGG